MRAQVGPGGAPAIYTAAQYGHVDIVHVTWDPRFLREDVSSGFYLAIPCGWLGFWCVFSRGSFKRGLVSFVVLLLFMGKIRGSCTQGCMQTI